MTAGLQHQIEIRADAATLYLSGWLQAGDLPRLRAICVTLPAAVSVLRVDLHGLVTLAPDAVRAVRDMLHEWRVQRGGSFRLTLATAHLLASYREERSTQSSPAVALLPGDRHALMATYL